MLLKLLLAMALLAMLWVMFSFSAQEQMHDGENTSGLQINVRDLPLERPRTLEWNRRPVLLLRLGEQLQRQLAAVDEEDLSDPRSHLLQLPAQGELAAEQLLMVIGLGTDLGCTLEYLPATDVLFRGKNWHGGFKDVCRGSRYDLAGRVYRDQQAQKNLQQPHWQWLADDRLLIVQ